MAKLIYKPGDFDAKGYRILDRDEHSGSGYQRGLVEVKEKDGSWRPAYGDGPYMTYRTQLTREELAARPYKPDGDT
jgi:hypothetical protein